MSRLLVVRPLSNGQMLVAEWKALEQEAGFVLMQHPAESSSMWHN